MCKDGLISLRIAFAEVHALAIYQFLSVHVSPAAAKGDARSTRGGNAALHDKSFVTLESIVHIAVLVCLCHSIGQCPCLTHGHGV